jgi:lipoprotein-anchoring transpeptidase ErfK/SrfK
MKFKVFGSIAILSGLSLTSQAQESPLLSAPTKQAETLVVEALQRIEAFELTEALNIVSDLARLHPDYHLAQMMRADLLAIRAGNHQLVNQVKLLYPITTGRLREEAEVRWQYAHTDEGLAETLLQSAVLKVGEQPYLIVVNLAKSRLYVYQNQAGELSLLANYYISMGTAGAGKEREGDRKTPIGVYHITDWVPGHRLADLYGFGALPLNYPNVWDKALGRTGHGIWLHGTPSNTFSRPPMSSQGCVVLNNDEMSSLVTHFNIGLATPVLIVNQDSDIQLYEAEKIEVLTEINAWLVEKGAPFNWQQVSVYRYPNEDGLYYATFPSLEKPDHLVHQYWRRNYDGGWQLVLETLDPKKILTRLS